MRSRLACVCTRVSVLSAVLVTGLLVAGTTASAGARSTVVAQPSPLESFGPVGSTAVVLGVVGMVAGVFRKKKIQPENQRKS
ncbi:hypothetical protein [Saccharopolyspora erythraea]|uniref:hypothetical protein n=1 Tax=Saccharopolyspora erythraea TaxID=1836 RepID=UPI0020127BED|nr:hypothetical protein [Saccharopolyspora erythraea]